MRAGAGLCSFLLYPTTVTGGLDADPQEKREEEAKRGGGGFLWRSFQQAKQIGEAIDPHAMAQVEQAWKELTPDLRQVADDKVAPNMRETVKEFLERGEDIRAAGQEAVEIWSNIKSAISGNGGGEGLSLDEVSAGLGLEALGRDAKRAAKEVVGDVFGEILDEVLVTFETRLSEALSEGNIREASQLWRRLMDRPETKLLARERWLWDGATRSLRQYLSSFMSEGSTMKAERAIKATTEFTLQFARERGNADKSDREVFAELSNKFCHLQGAVEKLWPLAEYAFPMLGYDDYITHVESAIRSRSLSRITLTVSSSALLLGLEPLSDPFLVTVISAFSLGHISRDVAQNVAAFFYNVFMDHMNEVFVQQQRQPSEQYLVAEREVRSSSTSFVELAVKLVSGTSTCEELGDQIFTFLELVQRALEKSKPLSRQEGKGDQVDPDILGNSKHSEKVAPPPQLQAEHAQPRSTRELNQDRVVLRQAIRVAGVIDNKHFDLNTFLLCLAAGVCMCFCGLVSVGCRRWSRSRRDPGRSPRRGGWVGGRVNTTPHGSFVKLRQKTA